MEVREVATADLTAAELAALRSLLDEAFGGRFADEDMDHALGGRHWLVAHEGRIVSHASVVPRDIEVAGRRIRTGYVEAVATAPAAQRTGLGSRVMRAAGAHLCEAFGLGALSTGSHGFYERLGWERWRGPAFVRHPDGRLERAEDDDDGIMVLRTPGTGPLDVHAPISCEWRPGDAW